MSQPLKFFVGSWDPKGYPIREGMVIQVSVTAEKAGKESFEVMTTSEYELLKLKYACLKEQRDAAIENSGLSSIAARTKIYQQDRDLELLKL